MNRVKAFRVDLTDMSENRAGMKLLEQLELVGIPAIVIYDRQGKTMVYEGHSMDFDAILDDLRAVIDAN